MNDIKFDSLVSFDFSAYANPSPSDYPEGRYSATITKVEAQTRDNSGAQTLRFKVNIGVDANKGKPQLRLTDYITLATSTGFVWAGINVFCDLMEIAGHDRDEVYETCRSLANAMQNANHTAASDIFSQLRDLAQTLPGTRVAPYIVWKQVGDNMFANVRGTKTCPSYVSAANEVDPAASFTGDDIDSPIETPKRGKRTLVQPKRK